MKTFDNAASEVAPQIPETAFADTSDGTLLRSAWANGLEVQHPGWTNLPPPGSDVDTVQFQIWQGATPLPDVPGGWTDTGAEEEVGSDIEFPLNSTIPIDLLNNEGPMALRLRISRWDGSVVYSDFVQFIADRTAPYDLDAPEPLTIAPSPITDAAFDDNGYVSITVPAYADYAAGDQVVIYLVQDNSDWPPPGTEAPALKVQVSGSGPTAYELPSEAITHKGSGSYIAGYALVDKAGNVSRASTLTHVSVALGDLASGMKPPLVPLAQEAADDVLLVQDVIQAVNVEIEPFDNADIGDVIRLYWGTQSYDVQPSDWPFPQQPLSLKVRNDIMLADYGSNTDAVETTVAYEVLRGGMVMGSKQTTTIKVNFHVEGPDDPIPGWPDPVNEALNAPVLVPSDPAGKDNALTLIDKGQPAMLQVKRVAGMVEGQVLKFYWDTQFIDQVNVPADTASPDIELEVPWDKIAERGNGIWSLYYQLVTPASGNYWQSPNQSISIAAVPLPGVKFPDVNTSGFLNCESLRNATDNDENGDLIVGPVIRVQVPDVSQYLDEGDELTLHWVPLIDFNGDEQASGTYDRTFTLGSRYSPSGFIWEIPYDPYVLCIYVEGEPNGTYYGRGRVHAEFKAWAMEWSTEIVEQKVVMALSSTSCTVPIP